MPEHDCLPPDMTATDFVSHLALISGLPRTAARERTAEVLRHVGLYEERYRAIGGYSTGMKQRVKLAQALVHDPRLLLLDEPTNGLDPAGRDEMLELIHRTGTEFGIAVIVASHLLGEIERVCDHLVAIEGGQLLRSAPLGSFTERTGTLAVEVEDGRDALAERLDRARAARRRRRLGGPRRPRRRGAVRHRPRHRRRARPAARPDRAAPPSARGPVPRRPGEPAAAAPARPPRCARPRHRRRRAPPGRAGRAGPTSTADRPPATGGTSTTSATAATRARGSGARHAIRVAHRSTASGRRTGSAASGRAKAAPIISRGAGDPARA